MKLFPDFYAIWLVSYLIFILHENISLGKKVPQAGKSGNLMNGHMIILIYLSIQRTEFQRSPNYLFRRTTSFDPNNLPTSAGVLPNYIFSSLRYFAASTQKAPSSSKQCYRSTTDLFLQQCAGCYFLFHHGNAGVSATELSEIRNRKYFHFALQSSIPFSSPLASCPHPPTIVSRNPSNPYILFILLWTLGTDADWRLSYI